MRNPGKVEWRDEDENFLHRLEQPWNFERQATGPNPFGSRPDAISFGAIKIRLNPEDWEMYAAASQEISKTNWNHAEITIKVGVAQFIYSEFETVFKGNIKNVEWTEDTLTLNVRDPDELLTEEIQKFKYGGAGGVDGTASMKGRAKPLLFGYGLNIQPVLVDPVWGVYQIHDGAINSVEEIFDGGYSFGPPEFDISDYPGKTVYDWEEVIAPATIQGGQWITDVANGLIRVGTGVAFTLTANAYGADHGERPFSANAAYVCEAVLIDRIGISSASIFGVVELDSTIPFRVGVYIPAGGTTANAVIQGILAPLQCFLGYTKRGQYEFRSLRTTASNGNIENYQIHKVKRLSDTPEPVTELRVSWGHNWTVRADDQLAENRDDDFAEFSIEEDRWASTTFGDASKSGKELDIQTYLIDESDAQSESLRQYLLMVGSDIYEITTDHRVLAFLPGDMANIKYDGLDFTPSTLMMLLSVRENGRSQTTVYRAWGNFTYDLL
jgi:hypothetical protein